MEILTVEYRRLISLPNYENVSVGVVVAVETSPEEAMEKAKAFVNSELAKAQEEKLVNEEREQARIDFETEAAIYYRKIKDLKETWERAKAFLAKHGVNVEEEIPF